MVFVTVHLASNLAANSLFLVLCLCTLFADYFQFDAFTVQLTGLRHELRYEDVYINSWTSFSDFSTYGCTYSNNDRVRTACSNISYFHAAGILYLLLITGVIGAVLLSMLSLYLRMLGKENQLSRMKLPHLLAAPGFCLAGATYLWVSNVDHLTHPDGTREDVEHDTGITLLFATAFVGILTLLHYLFLKHYRHIEDIGFSFKLFEEIQEKEDRIRDLEKDQKDYVALLQDLGDMKNFLGTPGSTKPGLRTLVVGDVLRVILEMWVRIVTEDRSTGNASMAVDSADGLVDRLSPTRKMRLGSGISQTRKVAEESKDPSDALLQAAKEKDELADQVERLTRQVEDLERQRITDAENFEAAEKERQSMEKMHLDKLQKAKSKNQKLKSAPPPSHRSADDNRDEQIAMQAQEIDELTLIIESLRQKTAALEHERDEALRRSEALASELEEAEQTLAELHSDLDKIATDDDRAELAKSRLLIVTLRDEIERWKILAEANDKEIKALRDQEAQLMERLRMALEDLDALQQQKNELKNALEQTVREKDALGKELEQLRKELANRVSEVQDLMRRLDRERADNDTLRRSLADKDTLGRERDAMGAEEVATWQSLAHQSANSTSDALSYRDREIDRLNRLLIELRSKQKADGDRLLALWAMRLEDAGSLALRERTQRDQAEAEALAKDTDLRDSRRTNEILRTETDSLKNDVARLNREKKDLERDLDQLRRRFSDAQTQSTESLAMSSEETETWRLLLLEERSKTRDSLSATDREVRRLALLVQSMKATHSAELVNLKQHWAMLLEDAASALGREKAQVEDLQTEVRDKDSEVRRLRIVLDAAQKEAADAKAESDRLKRLCGDLTRKHEDLTRELTDKRNQLVEVSGVAGEEIETWKLLVQEAKYHASDRVSATDQELRRLSLLLQSLKSSHSAEIGLLKQQWRMLLEDAMSRIGREHTTVERQSEEIRAKDSQIREDRQAIDSLRKEAEGLKADLDRCRKDNSALRLEKQSLTVTASDLRSQLIETSTMANEDTNTWQRRCYEIRVKANDQLSASAKEVSRLTLLIKTLKSQHDSDLDTLRQRWAMRLEDALSWGERIRLVVVRLTAEVEDRDHSLRELSTENEDLKRRLSEANRHQSVEQYKAEADRLRTELSNERFRATSERDQLKAAIASLYALIESLERSLMQENELNQVNFSSFFAFKSQTDAEATNAKTLILMLKRQLNDSAKEVTGLKAAVADIENRHAEHLHSVSEDAAASMLRFASSEDIHRLQKLLEDKDQRIREVTKRLSDSEAARHSAEIRAKDAEQQLQDLRFHLQNHAQALTADAEATMQRLALHHAEELATKDQALKHQAVQIESLKAEKDMKHKEVQTLMTELEQARGDLSEMTVRYDECQARNLELQHAVAKLEKAVGDLDQQRQEYRELINRLKQQIDLMTQVNEGKLTAAASEFEAEKDEIIEEFSRERSALQEEIDRLKEELAKLTEQKELQGVTLVCQEKAKTKLEEVVKEKEEEVQQLIKRQATLVDWLGAVWEDKEAMQREKDELTDAYAKKLAECNRKLQELQDEYDQYKRDQETWLKSVICAGEEKAALAQTKLKELEDRLINEQKKSKELDKLLEDAKRQQRDLAKQLEELTATRDQLQQEAQDSLHTQTVAESLRKELEAKNAEIARLQRLLDESTARITELTEALERARQEAEAQKSRAAQAESQLKESQEKAMRLASQVTSLKDENADLDAKNKEQTVQIAEIEQKILAAQLESQRLQQALARSEREILSLKPWMQKAKQAESELLSTKNQLAMKTEELDSVRTDLSLISSRNEELSLENDRLRGDNSQLQKDRKLIAASLAQAQNEVAKLARAREEDQQRIEELSHENQSLQNTIRDLQKRIAELEAAVKTTAEENIAMKARAKDANNERDKLRGQLNKLRTEHQQALTAAADAAQQSKDRADDEARKKAEEDLTALTTSCAQLQDKNEELEKLVDELRREMEDKLRIIADLEAKQSRYKKELARRKRVALLRILLKDWNKNLLLKSQKAVDRWHLQAAPKKVLSKPRLPEIVISSEDPAIERFQLLRLSSLEGELTDPEIKAGEALLQEEKNVLLRDNLIISTYKAAGLREAPLAFVNVFKFFEELMDKKFEVDQSDLLSFRKPRGMTEFMMEHLNRMFGLKNLAVKFLCQLLPALQTLYKQGHPYGSLFARLLQVFHKDPISFKLGLFLTRARVKFNQLVEKMEKERSVQGSGRSHGKKKQNLTSQQVFELAASGGEAFLSDVIYLVYDMFEQDKTYGELMLKLIKPAAIDTSDFIIFKICHKMAKLGLTPESLYDLIDVKREQNLLREEFIQGVQQTMDLWVDRTDLQTLFTIIDQNTSDTVSRDEFALKINFDSYYFNAKNEYYVVSKSTFLNALTDVYNEMYRNHAARLRMVYMEVGRKEMNLTKFRQVAMSIDPRYDLTKVDQMYSEAMRAYGEGAKGLGMEGFCKTLLQHGVGVMRLFETEKLEEAVERKSMGGGLDISLTSEGELVSLSSRRRSPVA